VLMVLLLWSRNRCEECTWHNGVAVQKERMLSAGFPILVAWAWFKQGHDSLCTFLAKQVGVFQICHWFDHLHSHMCMRCCPSGLYWTGSTKKFVCTVQQKNAKEANFPSGSPSTTAATTGACFLDSAKIDVAWCAYNADLLLCSLVVVFSSIVSEGAGQVHALQALIVAFSHPHVRAGRTTSRQARTICTVAE
jgi:hypothetical protein